MGNADWFFKIGDQVQGPLSPVELQQKAAAGDVAASFFGELGVFRPSPDFLGWVD